MQLLRSLPIQLILVIVGALLVQPYMSIGVMQGVYTFSVLFKALLTIVLPVIIFSYVMSGILSFQKGAPIALAILLALIFISNGFVALVSYVIALFIVPSVTCTAATPALLVVDDLSPLLQIQMPAWLSTSSVYVLFGAALLGLICSVKQVPFLEKFVAQCKVYVEYFITYFFLPLLPLYIFGFMIKLRYDGVFDTLFAQYGSTCLLIVIMQLTYLAFFYFLASGFRLSQAWNYIITALPSYVTAFSTMSSTAAIPVTVKAATKNTGNSSLSQMSVPIMANVHLLGDSIGTPLLSLVTLLVFKGCLPSVSTYMMFVLAFCIAMFGAAGLPGGGIIVMLPVLKTYFGFTSSMNDLVMSIYFLMDSFGTAANVMGDGALVIIVNKVLKRLKFVSKSEQ